MEENPWKIKSSRAIYENPWISLREDQVVQPSGNDGIYGVVHFHNNAIAILPMDAEHNTWLVGQYRYALRQYSWELPMGGGKKEEPVLAAAKRELLEETGIKAKQWRQLMHLYPSNSVTDEEGFIFLAEGLSFHEASPDETEVLKVKKVPFQEAVQMVLHGEIKDALCVAAILRVAYEFNQT